jgi:nucleotide-binding universal stress UspA family protein
LRIVSAWEVSAGIYGGGVAPAFDASTLDAFRERAQEVADEAVATVKKRQPAVECDSETVEGQPAAILLEEAKDAGLIVVGSRGLGGFARLLMGSVSQQVVHHASCPVVVVRAPHEHDR